MALDSEAMPCKQWPLETALSLASQSKNKTLGLAFLNHSSVARRPPQQAEGFPRLSNRPHR